MADHMPDSRTADGAPSVVVLLSGGLDSATALGLARGRGLRCHTLAFDYGQRHRHELEAAGRVAEHLGAATHRVVRLDLRAIGGSALTDDIEVPKGPPDEAPGGGIPVTYVPARNLVFLSIGVGLAEALGARALHIGVNAVDYSGYPDCRPEFIAAFERAATLATKAGVEGAPVRIETPLIDMTKGDIIRAGLGAGVDYALTHSCYDPVATDAGVLACGACDSCRIRRRGFADAGAHDPTRYAD